MTSEQYQAYIDTYMRNINSTDLGNLANVGNRVIHVSNQKKDFILPKLGKYYKKTWQIDFHGYEDLRCGKDWINTKNH